MSSARKANDAKNDLEILCRHCGQTLSDFLHQMEKHNAEVVCPSCGKKHVHGNSAVHSSGKSVPGH